MAAAKPQTVEQTDVYAKWFAKLRDINARAKINVRIDRVKLGNFGDVKAVGEGVSELRIDYGPGYRVYLMSRGDAITLLLCGGDKSTQSDDIAEAKRLARGVRADDEEEDSDDDAVG